MEWHGQEDVWWADPREVNAEQARADRFPQEARARQEGVEKLEEPWLHCEEGKVHAFPEEVINLAHLSDARVKASLTSGSW
jgi:hypothetical protein